jgi:hypothetical protein
VVEIFWRSGRCRKKSHALISKDIVGQLVWKIDTLQFGRDYGQSSFYSLESRIIYEI